MNTTPWGKSYPNYQPNHLSVPSVPSVQSTDPFDLLDGLVRSWTVGWTSDLQDLAHLRETSRAVSYPPHDIYPIDENSWNLRLAVAGFSRSDIEVSLTKNTLTITGKKEQNEDEPQWKGIATRDFTQSFLLAKDIKIVKAELVDGLLTIELKREIPDADKPQIIKVK